MRQVFLNKKLSYLIITMAIVVVLLACILITVLSQYASLRREADRLYQLIDTKRQEIETEQDWKDFIESNDFIIKWAQENGLLQPGDIVWQD